MKGNCKSSAKSSSGNGKPVVKGYNPNKQAKRKSHPLNGLNDVARGGFRT